MNKRLTEGGREQKEGRGGNIVRRAGLWLDCLVLTKGLQPVRSGTDNQDETHTNRKSDGMSKNKVWHARIFGPISRPDPIGRPSDAEHVL